MRAVDRYDSLFQYYGERYHLPWRLVKSLAAAESSMNPDAVSSEGAVGLMQFMAGTATENIPTTTKDRRDPEESIAGACNYLVRLKTWVDEWLLGHDVDPVDRWRIAIASYNAGPGYLKAAIHRLLDSRQEPTWEHIVYVLPMVRILVRTAKGWEERHCDWTQATNHGTKVVPDATVLSP